MDASGFYHTKCWIIPLASAKCVKCLRNKHFWVSLDP